MAGRTASARSGDGALNLSFPALGAQVRLGHANLEAPLRRAWGRELLRPAPTYQLELEESGARSIVPGTHSGPLQAVLTSQGPLELRDEGDCWALERGRVRFEVGLSRSRIWLPLDPTAAEALAGQLALTEVGRACGLISLHAAVLSRGGRAVAMTGQSGAGKSTAALRLLRRGWQLVAEDRAWLDPHTRRVVGADVGLRLHPDSVQRFAPTWLDRPVSHDAHGKLWFEVERASGAVLERLYLLDGSDWGLLSPASAVQALWASSGVPLCRVARQTVSTSLASLVRTLPLESVERDELVERLSGPD